MPFPAKEYQRLFHLGTHWGVSNDDMHYVVENGMLRVCIWLPLRFVERGILKDGRFAFEKHEHLEGFVAVRPEDCRIICAQGKAKLRSFGSISTKGQMLRLAFEPPQPAIYVRFSDLIVLEKDRQEFEKTYNISCESNAEEHFETNNKTKDTFIASNDYRHIVFSGQEYHLGDVQAKIVEMLHDASRSRNPWVHGKTLIYESGSNATRMRDVFKHKRNWRKLVASNDRGYYKLNVPLGQLQQTPADCAIQN